MSDKSDGEKEGNASAGQHPWMYYYLRYFVGAVVGAVLLLIVLWEVRAKVLPVDLLGKLPEKVPDSAADIAAIITAFGTAGLAYCYIASAPVLLLHAVRWRLPQTCKFTNNLGRLVALFAILGCCALWWLHSHECGLRAISNGYWWIAYLPFGFVVVVQAFLLCTCWADTVREEYKELAKNRARYGETKYRRTKDEYIESYRHLREHGNACSILVLEIILAIALAKAPSAPFFVGIVAVWIMPAAFVWMIGTWLEFGLKEI